MDSGLPPKFGNSPFLERTLDNVKMDHAPLIIGEVLPQFEGHKDMTWDFVKTHKSLLTPFKVSGFDERNLDNRLSSKYISQEFGFLEQLFDQSCATQNLVFDKKYYDRNRYSDILAYHHSRVVLQHGVSESQFPEADYINACFVNSPFMTKEGWGDKKLIASQGPLPVTTNHFWQMIMEQNVTMVVSTCKLQENGRTKCNQFWPGSTPAKFNISQSDNNDEFVQVELLEHAKESSYVERREMLAKLANGRQQRVTQIHFTGWPDHGVPGDKAAEDFELMLNHFVDWNLKSAPTEKAIVHCSAGIGRTGTTIALMEVIINICAQKNAGVKDPELSIFHVVRRLREQRYGAVQTIAQYQFMYKFMIGWLKARF